MSSDVATLPFIVGLMLTTAILHVIGVYVARPTFLKWSGSAITLGGMVLLGLRLQG